RFVEQILAARLADILAEHATEKPDVPAHRRGQLLPVRLPGHAPSASLAAVGPRGLSLSAGRSFTLAGGGKPGKACVRCCLYVGSSPLFNRLACQRRTPGTP